MTSADQRQQAASSGTTPVAIGPFIGGLHNASGNGEAIDDGELFICDNLEVDTDGSIANRPAIQKVTVSASLNSTSRIIGVFLPEGGGQYLVVCTGTTTRLLNTATGVFFGGTGTVGSTCAVQYNNYMYIVPQTGSTGGRFDSAGTFSAVAAIPVGDSAVIYKDRLFVAAGLSATSNSSRVSFSAAKDPTTWNALDIFDVEPGNGQKSVALIVMNNDLLIFKEHSTFKFGYATTPLKGQLDKVSSTIGVPAINCVVVYDNNSVYVMHDNSVYVLYNYQYEAITEKIAMTQTFDADLLATDVFGITIFRNRLFVRYYSNMYVLSLKTNRWCRWTSARKFSRLFVVPSASVGLDVAYAMSGSSLLGGQVFFIRDSRVDGIGTADVQETFTCSIQTKTFDFDIPYAFKVMTKWGLSIATLSDTVCKTVVPNAGRNYTWAQWAAYTWQQLNVMGMQWSNNTNVINQTIRVSDLGNYARKYLRLKGKQRFRQLYFTVNSDTVANTVSDAVVRIYDITIHLVPRAEVTKGTN
jgi:hypothetical protein